MEKAKQRLSPSYSLAYKFAAGEKFRTKVVHLATVETKIKGVEQTTKSRTISTRAWRIKEVMPAATSSSAIRVALAHLVAAYC